MSYHIVSIDSPQCSLSCKDGQLTCKSAEGERKLPLEDIASIIITSFSASIHSHLFLEAAKHGVALIICESFKPVSLVLPANRSTDTLLSRALLTLPEKNRQLLWQRTIDAKCQNQCSLATHLAPADRRLAACAPPPTDANRTRRRCVRRPSGKSSPPPWIAMSSVGNRRVGKARPHPGRGKFHLTPRLRPQPLEREKPRLPQAQPATLAHRMGEGLGVRAHPTRTSRSYCSPAKRNGGA